MISSIVECRISGHKNLKRSKMLKATSRSFSEASLRQIANFDVHIKNWFQSTTLKFLTHEFYLVLFFVLKIFWILSSKCCSLQPSELGNRGAIASLDFDRFCNPTCFNQGGRLCPSPHPLGFSKLPSAQLSFSQDQGRLFQLKLRNLSATLLM